MKMYRVCAVLLLSMMVVSPLWAQSVYTWTDENGVRHFSNTGLPQDAQEAVESPEEISPPVSTSPSANADTGAENEKPPENAPEGKTGEEAPGNGGKEQIDQRLAAKVEKERQRLESEIKRIKGLAIGKSFTPGMKDAMIKPLQEQLALLNADPERYFRMKREGAFQSGSGGRFESGPAQGPLMDSLAPIEESSSAGGSNETPAAPSPPAETKPPADQGTTDGQASGAARSIEPGASLRSPDE